MCARVCGPQVDPHAGGAMVISERLEVYISDCIMISFFPINRKQFNASSKILYTEYANVTGRIIYIVIVNRI